MSETLKRTPLYEHHRRLGARLVPFAGWEMPVQYSGITAEHLAVRTAVGVFDISHMGKLALTGPGITGRLDRLVPSNLAKLSPGQAQYTLLLDEAGGILDDIILYREAEDRWVAIVNGATSDKDRTWLSNHLKEDVLVDSTAEQVLLALQGPNAQAVLADVTGADLAALGRYCHCRATVLGAPAFIARTGYTGEDGFEIMLAAAAGVQLWEALLAHGVLPCGLGARDTLRLEAAMHLYGQDMDESVTPLEAGLAWLIDWSKPEFVGHGRLRAQKAEGVTRRLVGFEVEGRQPARPGYAIVADGRPVGTVTSGTVPPTVARPIGLGYVSAELSQPGTPLAIEMRGKLVNARVVKRPFYRRFP
jgi:aminomethyltransferase